MAEIRWTPPMVEERLVEAADVMRRLPEVRAPGYFNTWPKILPEFSDLVGQEPPKLMRLPPSSDAITRMDETLGWLRWARSRGRQARLGARLGLALEGHLLAVRHQPDYGASPLGVCAQSDGVETQRTAHAGKRSRQSLVERVRFLSS